MRRMMEGNVSQLLLNLYQFLSVSSQNIMRSRAIPIREVKCNFCHNWIEIPFPTPPSLYICLNCRHTYQTGALLHDQKGNPLRFALSPQQPHHFLSPNNITSPSQKWLKHSGVSTNHQGSEEADERKNQALLKQYFSEPLCGLRKKEESIYKNKSQIIETIGTNDTLGGQPYLQKRGSLLGDNTVAVTQKKQRGYNFYYQSEDIELFKCQSQKQERQFGTQLSNLQPEDLFLPLRRNSKSGVRSNRSTTSLQPQQSGLKLKEEALKQKIDTFLQGRYQSTSLHRILATNVRQAYEWTNIQNKMTQLVSFNISQMDLACYLNLLDGDNASTLKLVSVGLRDDNLALVLDWVWSRKVQCLVLTCNKLTQGCLVMLLNRSLPNLRQIYLGKNRINKCRVKENIIELRSKFILYL